jgi:D-alanyl-D-alanine-carboxypeptidase/D-alanyl-D-alanine-endopeptidase
MKQLRLLCTGLLLGAFLSNAARCQDDTFDLERTKEVLTAEIERRLEAGTASISIALVRGDEIVWTAAFGYANVHARALATPETIYCTGSTFKAVTATAIMQLVEAGEVSLDDPVNDHLGEHQVDDLDDKPVTIRHILSHVSGLNAGASTTPIWERRLPKTLAEMTSGLRSVRPPEEEYEYNNHAYGMAGYLIEQVTGESYEDYIVENVLEPLGVRTPGPVNPTPEMIERMALPYSPSADGPRPVAQVRYDVYPAGDIYLTAEDLARFLGAHLNGGVFQGKRILSEESVVETHRPQFFDYGLGWGVSRSGDRNQISHSGGVPGFLTNMSGDLGAKVGAYVMSNSGDMSGVARAALALLRGEDYVTPSQRKTVEVGEEILEEYVGRYELQPDFVLSITRDAGQLFVQATGQARLRLHAATESEFFLREVEASIVFVRNDQGVVDQAILEQGGERAAKRIE